MESVSHEADDLVRNAQAAFDSGNYVTAIRFLRQAAEIAPLRQDIKLLLAAALEHAPSSDRDSLRPDTATLVSNKSPEHANALGSEFLLRRIEEQLGQKTEIEEPSTHQTLRCPITQSPDDSNVGAPAISSQSLQPNELVSTRSSNRVSSAKTLGEHAIMMSGEHLSADNPRLNEASQWTNSQSKVDTAPTQREGRESPAFDKVTAKRRRKRERNITDQEDLLGDTSFSSSEFHELRFEWMRSPLFATLIVYGTIFTFVGLASAVTYQRFFRVGGGEATGVRQAAGNKPTKAPHFQVASPTQQEVARRATDYLNTGHHEEAIALITRYLSQTKQDDPPEPLRVLLARAYDAKGTALLSANKLEESVAAYQKATEYAPSQTDFVLHLANARFYCGTLMQSPTAKEHLTTALSGVEKVIESDSKNVVAYELKAAICQAMQKTSEAKATLTRIIELAPASKEAAHAKEQIAKLGNTK